MLNDSYPDQTEVLVGTLVVGDTVQRERFNRRLGQHEIMECRVVHAVNGRVGTRYVGRTGREFGEVREYNHPEDYAILLRPSMYPRASR